VVVTKGLEQRERVKAKLQAALATGFPSIVEIFLKPSIELRQLATEALSKSLDPDPLMTFSSICRVDLDNVRRRML
jgi:hypothetical protein